MNISEQLTQIATKEAENIELNQQLRDIVSPESRNLFDCLNAQPPKNTYSTGIITDRTESSITVQKTHDGIYECVEFVLPKIPAGEKINVCAEWTCSSNNLGMIRVNWNTQLTNKDIIASSLTSGVSGSGVVTEQPDGSSHLSLLLYGGTSGGVTGDEVYYKNVMVNIGDTALKFEPYKPKNTMSLSEGINQLDSDVQNIKMSIEDKGVEVSDTIELSGYSEKVDEVYAAGQSSMVDESKIIEKTVSGEYISVDDVSEIPHEVKVQLTSGGKNLFNEQFRQGDVSSSTNTTVNKIKIYSTQSIKIKNGKTYTFSTSLDISIYKYAIHVLTQAPPTSWNNLNSDSTWQLSSKVYAFTSNIDGYLGVYIARIDGGEMSFEEMKDYWFMLEEGDTATPYEPYKETLTDYSGVSLTRCGGNLFDCLNAQPSKNTYSTGIITDRTESSITVQKTHDGIYECVEFVLPKIPAGEKINVCAEWTCSSNNLGMIRVNWNTQLTNKDIIASSLTSGVSGSGVVTEQPDGSSHLSLLLYGGTSGGVTGDEVYYKNVMVNIGDTALKFEPYKGQTLTAKADGTVEGVKSTSPYMYMKTDDENVTINAEYHKSYGMQTEYDRFWDKYQDNGNRVDYSSAFRSNYWKDEIFKPKYPIQPTNAESMFSKTLITDIRMVDLTQATNVASLCNSSTQGIKYVGEIGNSSITTFGSAFGWCHKLISVEKMIVSEKAQFPTTFEACYDLESITFEGIIAYNISFAGSSKLNKSSILSVFNALSSTATGKTLTLSTTAVNNAFETSSGVADGSTSTEWTTLVATKTNWTISLV